MNKYILSPLSSVSFLLFILAMINPFATYAIDTKSKSQELQKNNADTAPVVLTEDDINKSRINMLNNVKKDSMLVFSPQGTPKGHVTIFTDIDCGYCRKLHGKIADINKLGVEVRYLIFPRSGPDTESFNKAISVWCSKDKNTMFSLAMEGREIPKASCKNPLMSQFDLGMKLRISGTPTLIFADGSVVYGYISTAKLARLAIERTN